MENRKLRATPAARTLARRLGVDLFNVTGTGYKGRIHKDDVAGFNYEEKIHISPLAQRIADEHNIDLKGVVGTGYGNKIMKDDVLQLIADPELKARFSLNDFGDRVLPASVTGSKPAVAQANPAPKSSQKEQPSPQSVPAGETETVPMTQMRTIIARRMTESYFGAPTFIQTWEVDMTELLDLRKRLMEPIKEKTGKKLTVTDLISMAVVKTLMKHKYVNASINREGTEITFHNYVNLGMAVGLDEGLLVPVVKGADKMSLSELVVALKDLTERTFSKNCCPMNKRAVPFPSVTWECTTWMSSPRSSISPMRLF